MAAGFERRGGESGVGRVEQDGNWQPLAWMARMVVNRINFKDEAQQDQLLTSCLPEFGRRMCKLLEEPTVDQMWNELFGEMVILPGTEEVREGRLVAARIFFGEEESNVALIREVGFRSRGPDSRIVDGISQASLRLVPVGKGVDFNLVYGEKGRRKQLGIRIMRGIYSEGTQEVMVRRFSKLDVPILGWDWKKDQGWWM